MPLGSITAVLAEATLTSASTVEAMAGAAPHRGERVETLLRGRCALACTNRADFTDAYVANVDGIAAAFAGTLDNARELAGELDAGAPASTSPAALIAAGFRSYGEALPQRLRGVFAGIVTDGDRIFCFRDHLGYGLLFHRHDGRRFYAATEAKQVVAGADIRSEPDLDVVERIFYNTYDDETPCALRGVRRLPKAHGILVGRDGVRLRQYWKPESLLETGDFADGELQGRFEELMDQAVRRAVTGQDVISLSGGIDSPAVAAFAAPRHLELTGRPLQALTAVFPRHPSVDERRYVELLSARFGIPLHTFEQRANSLDDLAYWVRVADGPYPAASLAQYAEDYRLARGLGARRVLTGEHAEFVFALNWYLIDHLVAHGRLRALGRQVAARRGRGDSWPALALLFAQGVAPATVLSIRERRSRLGLPAWIDGQKASEGVAEGIVSPRERWRRLQLSAFRGPGLSAEAEAICQAVCGVQTRRPWTDVDLFEFFLSLPAEQKFPDTRGKSLVRRFLRGRVPDAILDRRDKTVFNAALLADIDYATLRRYLIAPDHRLDGVDYDKLAERLDARDLDAADFRWARHLAGVHAFLAQW